MNVLQKFNGFLFPQRKEELYVSLHNMLGFRPRNLDIYRLALRHKSLNRKDDDHTVKRTDDNERLEFLGDAILEAVVSNYLFRKYPNQPEGFLTTSRSKMVRRSTLGQLATKIGLEQLVKAVFFECCVTGIQGCDKFFVIVRTDNLNTMRSHHESGRKSDVPEPDYVDHLFFSFI